MSQSHTLTQVEDALSLYSLRWLVGAQRMGLLQCTGRHGRHLLRFDSLAYMCEGIVHHRQVTTPQAAERKWAESETN